LKKLKISTLLLVLALCFPFLVFPMVNAVDYTSVMYAGMTVNYAGPSPNQYDADRVGVFSEISGTVSFSSLPPPLGIFEYNWLGADSINANGDIVFFQICLAYPNAESAGLTWLVEDNDNTTNSGMATSPLFPWLTPIQTYNLEMFFNGTGWQLACNGIQVYYFSWPYESWNVQVLTETWFVNGSIPNIGTSDFTNLQVRTSQGYIPMLALPSSSYAIALGSTTYNSNFPLWNGAVALSDSAIQTGFGYPTNTTQVTTYSGQDAFSSTPYFNLQTITVPPTKTSSFPTPTPSILPYPSSAPKMPQQNNSPLTIVENNLIVVPFLVGAVVMVILVATRHKKR
jgi:hypothetical protein